MRKGKGLLRLIAVGMSWSMLLAAPIPVLATSTKVSELEKQKEELEQQKKDADAKKKQEQQNYQNASGKVSSIQSDVDAISDEIDEIDESLVETIASVEIIRDEVSQKEDQIKTTTEELQKAQETEQEQYAAMKLRVKFMYEKGDSTYLQLLMESQNFGEMVNKVEYVEKLYDYDRKLLEEYIAARQAVEALKNQLEDEKAELEAQQHELEEEQKSLEEILTEKKATYDNYEVQLAQAKQEAAVYKANIKKQNDEIKRLEAASAAKQSEIDAAKQAEEEARRAQELALQKQAESSGALRSSRYPPRPVMRARALS